jgi:sigma-B regulation protein RsbU (phosphoserine phosphatase)
MTDADYPVYEVPIRTTDRFLLYTDGVIDPENAGGEVFGDRKLEEVALKARSSPPGEFVDRLLAEICHWQPISQAQQDDITLVVVDVV